MSGLSEIREALVRTATEYVTTDGQDLYGYPYVTSAVNLPAVLCMPGSNRRDNEAGNFSLAMARGTESWTLQLIVLVPRTDDAASQKQLDGFLSKEGPNSIRQAIWDTPDLGLGDVDAQVIGAFEYHGSYDMVRTPHAGAALIVKVHAF